MPDSRGTSFMCFTSSGNVNIWNYDFCYMTLKLFARIWKHDVNVSNSYKLAFFFVFKILDLAQLFSRLHFHEFLEEDIKWRPQGIWPFKFQILNLIYYLTGRKPFRSQNTLAILLFSPIVSWALRFDRRRTWRTVWTVCATSWWRGSSGNCTRGCWSTCRRRLRLLTKQQPPRTNRWSREELAWRSERFTDPSKEKDRHWWHLFYDGVLRLSYMKALLSSFTRFFSVRLTSQHLRFK